jgi:lysozyme
MVRQIELAERPNAMRQTTAEDRAFTAGWEGKVKFVYDDAISPPRKWIKGTKVKGNLTAGVGHLLSPDEIERWAGKTIPDNVIDQWLDDDMNDAEAAVNELVKVDLNNHQYGTLTDFNFNIGRGQFKGSTLLRKLNKGDYASVPAELLKWTKTTINGVKVHSNGLKARRLAEGVYWTSGVSSAPKGNKPVGTEIATPSPKPWTPTEIIGAGSTVGTVAAAGFGTEGILSYVFAGILILAVIVIVAIVIKRQFFRS